MIWCVARGFRVFDGLGSGTAEEVMRGPAFFLLVLVGIVVQ